MMREAKQWRVTSIALAVSPLTTVAVLSGRQELVVWAVAVQLIVSALVAIALVWMNLGKSSPARYVIRDNVVHGECGAIQIWKAE